MFSNPDVLWKEAALTLRSLRRELMFTVLSVVLLALGIGFASAVFTLLWQAVYAQLPVPEAEQIFTFYTNVTHMGRSDSDASAQTFSVPMYRYLSEHLSAANGMIGRHGETVNMETPNGSQHLLAEFVTGNFFDVLGVKASIGRTFAQQPDHFAAVLSYDFWQEAYGGQANAWNSILRINGVPFRIIGVAAPGFRGLLPDRAPKLYLPVEAFGEINPGWRGYDDWGLRWLNVFARIPGKTPRATAEAELQPVYRAGVREELASEGTQPPDYLKELSHEHISLAPASQGVHGAINRWQEPLRILQWMTLAVLFLAAINVAGLMVVRTVKQKHETLIRYALGATRTAVMRLHFLQTIALAMAGGLLGLFVARWGAQLLIHLARLDRYGGFVYRPQGWALGAHWAAALLIGLLVGLFPALQAAKIDLAAGISEGASTHSGTRSQAFTRRALAAAQIALSLMLAVTAGLFGQALHKLITVPVGFNPEHMTVFSIDAKLAHSTVESTSLLWANIERRLRETPDVQAVTYGTGGPFPQGADAAVVIPGASSDMTAKHQSGMRSMIGPRYFTTLGIPMVAGREFDERDRQNTPGVVILNQTLARQLFDDKNPIGQVVTLFNGLDPNWLATVVGVAADHHQSWKYANAKLVYTPAQQARRVQDINYYVRTNYGFLPEQTIQTIVRREAPAISPYDVETMPTRMAEFASGERAMTLLVSVFAALALAIAAAGIYGVVAYGASLRTVEFAVRVSVGARPPDIIRLVAREAVMILACGVILAAPLTYFGLSIVRHQLEGISFRDPGVYVGAVLLLSICSLMAAWLPTRRALRMSVHGALRHS
jgi:putative ABC transport system permease protein